MEEQVRIEVAKTEKKCYQMLLEELRKCEEAHLVELDGLRCKIKLHASEYENLKCQLVHKESVRKKTESKLREVVEEFQNFIDLTKGFTKGQSEFLLPDMNLLQDMLKGVVASCQK